MIVSVTNHWLLICSCDELLTSSLIREECLSVVTVTIKITPDINKLHIEHPSGHTSSK